MPVPSDARPDRSRAVQEHGRAVDFGKTSDDYARYRPGPPASFYDQLDKIVPLRGCRAADVGTGTGVAAIELAARGAAVTAIDIAAAQVQAAKARAELRGVRVDFRLARAEETGLEPSGFDLYVALQCWHWFDAARAAAEALRLLRPGGVIAIGTFDYLSSVSVVARRSEELVLKFNPAWPMAGDTENYMRPRADLAAAGFVEPGEWKAEHLQPFTHEAWRGRMRTCNGVGASLSPEKVAAFDRDLDEVLRREFPGEPIHVAHRVTIVWARKPR